ncbi:MAG TPA: nucleotide-binding protein, partial [Streptosporangiaceae bacterium]
TQLIQARDTISSWGHTEIDDLLLEAGIPGVSAGRELGSRRDRANAIIRYALEHPSETTAEESLFSAFLVKRAASSGGSTGEGPAHADVPIPAGDPLAAAAPALTKTTRATNAVFVVHGRNEAVRAQVVEFLASLGLRPIVLHEQPNMGRHLLTKFIQEAELITFAVVLMTDDDVGAQRDAPIAPRARQNVILELGYFLSHLGQARVCALVSPGLETPSDFDGIVYIRIDPEGRWRTDLERELRAADMPLRVA